GESIPPNRQGIVEKPDAERAEGMILFRSYASPECPLTSSVCARLYCEGIASIEQTVDSNDPWIDAEGFRLMVIRMDWIDSSLSSSNCGRMAIRKAVKIAENSAACINS
ncbi:581_t:CDS:2, partial [Acaulospora colombiana]